MEIFIVIDQIQDIVTILYSEKELLKIKISENNFAPFPVLKFNILQNNVHMVVWLPLSPSILL